MNGNKILLHSPCYETDKEATNARELWSRKLLEVITWPFQARKSFKSLRNVSFLLQELLHFQILLPSPRGVCSELVEGVCPRPDLTTLKSSWKEIRDFDRFPSSSRQIALRMRSIDRSRNSPSNLIIPATRKTASSGSDCGGKRNSL